MTDHSEDIGFLKAKAENTEKQMEVLFKKNDTQTLLMNEIHTLLKTHVSTSEKRHDAIEEEIGKQEQRLKYCEKASDDHYAIKKFAMWATGILSAVWTGIWKAIDHISF